MFNLSLTPPQIEFVLKPGVTLTQAYQVTNESDQKVTLNTQVLPFLPSGGDGSVTYNNLVANPNIVFSLSNADLKLGQPFTLQSKESKQIVLKITASSQTSLSDYYSTFFVYQSPDKSANGTTISQTSGQIGSHILLSVATNENPKTEGIVQKFSLTPKIKDVFFTPIRFSGQIQNNSNYFFKTSGKITISKNQQTIKELKLDSQNILANYYRQFSCDNQQVCTFSPPLWPGKYTATLEFEPNLNIPSSSVSFIVMPISPILLIGIILLISYLIHQISKIFIQKQT